MAIDKKNSSANQQDHGHQEGQMNNTPSIKHQDGQRRSDNHSQSMNNMLQDSEEQKEGKNRQEEENR